MGDTSATYSPLSSDGAQKLPAELVLASVGVIPNTQLAEDAGLKVNRGIVVDEYQRTSDPHIYAVGDATTKIDAISGEATLIPLAQTANRHGRLVADNITSRGDEDTIGLAPHLAPVPDVMDEMPEDAVAYDGPDEDAERGFNDDYSD